MNHKSLAWTSSAAVGPSHGAMPSLPTVRPFRRVWLAAGCLCLLLGTVGIVVPLLPTVDFYVMAAWCFGRGSRRWENWLLNHPRIGPMVRDWRADRSVPLKAKWLATLSMTLSCLWAAQVLPLRTAWIPALFCLGVAAYLWTRPTRRPTPVAATPAAAPPNDACPARGIP